MKHINLLLGLLFFIGLTSVNAIEIKKSNNDSRKYQYLSLDNGMKIMLISDPKTQRAAAAVDVNIGSADEPNEFPGLAHFLEHMLFLGTDLYPTPDDYLNFISDHGGNHNAYTAFDHTNFFFDIDPNYLHEGLQRFSRFFVKPLLTEKYVERERNAVNSEYQSKLKEDGWRGMEVFKDSINSKHPYARFSIGNNDTLPTKTVRAALVKFYEKYYSADNMSAVIIGKEPLATLESWARTLFNDVPKRDDSKPKVINEKLFTGLQLPLLVKSQSLKNKRELSLSFDFPYDKNSDYNKSLNYISFILGYEGEGSLLAGLKKAGLANELYAGGQKVANEINFEIGIELTEKGYQQVPQILSAVFSYIDLLKNNKASLEQYKELSDIAEIRFKFREKTDAMSESSGIASLLNNYPASDVIALDSIYTGFDAKSVNGYLAQMTPSNMLVQLSAPDITEPNKSKYFSVPYAISKLDFSEPNADAQNELVKQYALHMPNSNKFIAKNFDIIKANSEEHKTLENGVEYYLNATNKYNVPKLSIQLSLQPAFKMHTEQKVMMSLLADLVDEELTSDLYDASIAGLNASIAGGEKSLAISVDGYNDKAGVLVNLLLKGLANPKFDPEIFNQVKTQMQDDLENTKTQMPYQQTLRYLSAGVLAESTLPNDKLAVLPGISLEKLKNFSKLFNKSIAVKALFYGNVDDKASKAIAEQFSIIFPKTNFKNAWLSNSAKKISHPESKIIKVMHTDNAITVYLQGDEGYKARANMGLLAKIISPPFFTELRTEKQLGYIVFASPNPMYNKSAIMFVVQSPVAKADDLDKDIIDFYSAFAKQIDALSDDEFKQVKQIFKSELLQTDKNLNEAASNYWNDIITTKTTKSARKAIADELDKLTKAEFIKFYQNLIKEKHSYTVKAVPN